MQAQPQIEAVPAAQHSVRLGMLVSTGWLEQHLHDRDLVLLCISQKRDFCSAGAIPGTRWIALSDLVVTRDGIPNELPPPEQLQRVFEQAGVRDNSHVVLYGERSGLFAARAYYTLDYLGTVDRASLLDGGLEKWKAEKRELSQEELSAKPGRLTLHLNQSIVIELPEMQQIVQRRSAALIDARPPLEFSGAKLSEDVSKSGHIPHASGLYWMDTLESSANPVLLPENRLREMYAKAGAEPNRRVITYCRTGMQSSFDYFIAKYLGYDAAMYDGSFFEWSRHNLPVETEKHPAVK